MIAVRRAASLVVVVAVAILAAFVSPRTHVVRISQFEFAPAELTVGVGDTVVWRNADLLPHTSAADSGTWSSAELAPDSSFTFVAADTGRFPYHCAAHPSMRGLLVVR